MLNDLPLHKLRLSYQQMFKDLKKESIEAKIVKVADSFLDYESIGYLRKFFKDLWQSVEAVSYTHLTLPTTERV